MGEDTTKYTIHLSFIQMISLPCSARSAAAAAFFGSRRTVALAASAR